MIPPQRLSFTWLRVPQFWAWVSRPLGARAVLQVWFPGTTQHLHLPWDIHRVGARVLVPRVDDWNIESVTQVCMRGLTSLLGLVPGFPR